MGRILRSWCGKSKGKMVGRAIPMCNVSWSISDACSLKHRRGTAMVSFRTGVKATHIWTQDGSMCDPERVSQQQRRSGGLSDTIFEKIREGCQMCDYESIKKYAYQDERNLRRKVVYERNYTFNYPDIRTMSCTRKEVKEKKWKKVKRKRSERKRKRKKRKWRKKRARVWNTLATLHVN